MSYSATSTESESAFLFALHTTCAKRATVQIHFGTRPPSSPSIVAFVANFFREYECVTPAWEKFTPPGPPRAVKGKSASPRDGLRKQSGRISSPLLSSPLLSSLLFSSVIIKFVALLRVISGGGEMDPMCRNANHPIDQNCGKNGEAESETATIDSETPSRETFSVL